MKTPDDASVEILSEKLRWLRLTAMAGSVQELLNQAAERNLTPTEVLHRLCDEEKQGRLRRAFDRRVREANFPEINTVDMFDFNFDACRKKLRNRFIGMLDLGFITRGINPLFIGAPGSGKTFLARSLAYRACEFQKRAVVVTAAKMLNELCGAEIHGALERKIKRYVKAELLVIDDFATLAMDQSQAKLAFEVISERYDYRRSTSITTNRAFKDWTKVFPDALNAQVIAERLTERAEIFVMEKGYRLNKKS
jgi:DNA replication protein DnaC